MKRIEITYRSTLKELEKLNARRERAEKALEKKRALAEKYGVAGMTAEEHKEWLAGVETTEDGWIVNKKDINRNSAYYDYRRAENELNEVNEDIERTEKRFDKVETELDRHNEEIARIETLQEKERLAKADFEEEQKEWKKDGITLESRYTGTTPKGKRFTIFGNNGFTERSRHCFTLYINGETIFTSGEFWRAYGTIKNS